MTGAGPTVGRCLDEAAGILRAAGVESARREARLLLAHALGRPAEWLLAHPEAAVPAPADMAALVERRTRREPLSHILGEREFWSLSFRTGPAVLDPRPDSETVVAAALDLFPDDGAPLRILDLGTGSGCLLLSVLSERPAAIGLGIDLSPAAAALARDNARRLGLSARAMFAVGDWAEAIATPFDLVLANPPYIPHREIAGLEPEVAQYDPAMALDGGGDGLDAYRAIAGQLCRLLGPDGRAVMEFGAGQESGLPPLLSGHGLETVGVRHDMAGRPRCLVARKAIGPDKKVLGKRIVTV